MQLKWEQQKSTVKPAEIDDTSSQSGVYLRKNIKSKEDGSYVYDEAYLNLDEYEDYKLEKTLLQEPSSMAYENFKTKLDTPVQYVNGLYYKPSYYKVYQDYINETGGVIIVAEKAGKDISSILAQNYAVYDVTETVENMRKMNVSEVCDLYFFLLAIKEKYFAEYKAEKVGV